MENTTYVFLQTHNLGSYLTLSNMNQTIVESLETEHRQHSMFMQFHTSDKN